MKRASWMLVPSLILAACGSGSARGDAGQAGDGHTPRIITTIEVGRVHAISAGAGGLWTANYEDGTVSLVDPNLNEVIQTVSVQDELGSGATDVHALAKHVWLSAADGGTVGHLDPQTLEVGVAAQGGPASIIDTTAYGTEVWLTQYSGDAPMDPVSAHGADIRSANLAVPLPGHRFAVYSDIAAGDAGVWALDESEGTLAAISPNGGEPRVAATGEDLFRGAQADIAVGHGYVWVETSDAGTRLTRFDPSTSERDSLSVTGRGGVFAVGPDAIWLLTHEENEGLLWRIDPESLARDSEPFTIDGEYQLADLSYGFGSIWVSHDTNLVTRIDVSGSQVVAEPPPSPEPRGDAEVCNQRGPWVYCVEARWLRRVVIQAGFDVAGDTGTALEIATESHSLYAWNAAATRPVEDVAANEGYQPREGTEVFTDGHRILWEAQGLHMYMSSADEKPIDTLPNALIDRLVEASRVVPMAVDLVGVKPQPTPTGEQRSEQMEDGRVRVWPATEDVENEGKYLFTAPHCGLDWMIDFDASFWRAVKPDDYADGEHYPFFYNSDEGTITFKSADAAVYQASTGEEIELFRLDGPIIIDPCA